MKRRDPGAVLLGAILFASVKACLPGTVKAVRVSWQIFWPADSWNDERKKHLRLKARAESCINLGGRNKETSGWEQISCVYISHCFCYLVTLFPMVLWNIRRLRKINLRLKWYPPAAFPILIIVFESSSCLSCNHPHSPFRGCSTLCQWDQHTL